MRGSYKRVGGEMILAPGRSPPSLFLPTLITPKPVPKFAFPASFPLLSFSPPSSSGSKHRNGGARFRNCCTDDKDRGGSRDFFEDFSMLVTNVPWDSRSIWSTMAAYLFSLHIPLSFGGLPAICQVLNQPVLDPLTEAASLILLQTLEVAGALMLLHYSAKKRYKLSSFFQHLNNLEERNWIKAASFGLIFLILVVLLTSLVADRLIGPKDVNNPELKDILLSGLLSEAAFFFIYCFLTPMLEEAVYRGFLLTSLATTMNWQLAVIISAFVFSLAHFSSENFLQLFFIGCVLGSAYCWSGNLVASFVIHSVYNAIVLLVIILS